MDAPRPTPFVVFSLPRSRSAWLAHWLAGAGIKIGHDISIMCDSPEDFISAFGQGMSGTVETAGVQGWRLIKALMPGVRFVTVRRPASDVLDSLRSLGLWPDETELALRNLMLDEVELAGFATRFEYEELKDPARRVALWGLLVDAPLDPSWDAELAELNIQVDMRARVLQLASRAQASAALAAQVLRRTSELPPCRALQ